MPDALKKKNYQRYLIQLDGESLTVINPRNRLDGLATKKTPKVYVVSTVEKILYVGSTRLRLSTRLRAALKVGKAWEGKRKGYKGYPWKFSIDTLRLDVWLLPEVEKDGKLFIETIEAEVVYLVRKSDDDWPTHQMGVHFHSSNLQHRAIAKEIYNTAKRP